ncbi:MAG: hypothetical protein NUV56_02270, partial [Candidatus Uhrbacteria bacterium]|nr:hypothetical protein [Candidatus Uhrbacteria bacterium]
SPFESRRISPMSPQMQAPSQTPIPAIPIPEDRLRNMMPQQQQQPMAQQPIMQQPMVQQMQQQPERKQDDDDLGIPAFIRRKMM